MKETIQVFRYKIIRIQRWWRHKRDFFVLAGELVLRKWNKELKWLRNEQDTLGRAISALKDQKNIGTKKRVAKREELDQALAALPKLPKKITVPASVRKQAAAEWIRKSMDAYKQAMREYYSHHKEYLVEAEKWETIAAARAAVGATSSRAAGMPIAPKQPKFKTLPSKNETFEIIRRGIKLRGPSGTRANSI